MTANQINYAKLKEDTRSHLANEQIASRQAAASERQAAVAERNAETQAYNAETNRMSLDISREANAIQAANVAEQARSHQASEEISRAKISADYTLGQQNLVVDTARTNADVGLTNARVGQVLADTALTQAKTASERVNKVQKIVDTADTGIRSLGYIAETVSKFVVGKGAGAAYSAFLK